MNKFLLILAMLFIIILLGCDAIDIDEPPTPSGMICNPDGFLYDPTRKTFVLTVDGGALECDFVYAEG